MILTWSLHIFPLVAMKSVWFCIIPWSVFLLNSVIFSTVEIQMPTYNVQINWCNIGNKTGCFSTVNAHQGLRTNKMNL